MHNIHLCKKHYKHPGGETNNKKNNNKSSCGRYRKPEKISKKGTQTHK